MRIYLKSIKTKSQRSSLNGMIAKRMPADGSSLTPYVAALPGLMIFLTSMCFNLMSDGFRSAMDVRLNK